MNILILVLLSYFPLLFLIQITLLLLFFTTKKEKVKPVPDGLVSVLLAARNEEDNIVNCLMALDRVDWPSGKLEILIGNDHSTDKTEELIKDFIAGKDHFKLINIHKNLGMARGKANVLAHLAKEAKGDFFFITDADIRVPETWIKGILSRRDSDDGTVSGVSMVKGKGWFASFQEVDWISAFGMITVMAKRKVPVSAVGNNMMITREAYESTGGYENIPFSLTEDFELFKQTLKKGWDFQNLLNPEILAFSAPVSSIAGLFQQRKRWMTGAIQLPFIMLFVLSVQSLFLAFLILAFFVSPLLAISLWGVKASLQWLLTLLTLRQVGQTVSFGKLLFHEVSNLLFSFLQLVYFVLPVEIKWKNRSSKELFKKMT